PKKTRWFWIAGDDFTGRPVLKLHSNESFAGSTPSASPTREGLPRNIGQSAPPAPRGREKDKRKPNKQRKTLGCGFMATTQGLNPPILSFNDKPGANKNTYTYYLGRARTHRVSGECFRLANLLKPIHLAQRATGWLWGIRWFHAMASTLLVWHQTDTGMLIT